MTAALVAEIETWTGGVTHEIVTRGSETRGNVIELRGRNERIEFLPALGQGERECQMTSDAQSRV